MDIKTLNVEKIELKVWRFETEPKTDYAQALSDIKRQVKQYWNESTLGKKEKDYVFIQMQAPCVMATQDRTPTQYVGYARGLVVPKEILPYIVDEE